MSHNYLFDTYAYIASRLDEVRQQAPAAGDNPQVKQSTAGRIEALSEFESYLSENFDAKLPRRLSRQRKKVDI